MTGFPRSTYLLPLLCTFRICPFSLFPDSLGFSPRWHCQGKRSNNAVIGYCTHHMICYNMSTLHIQAGGPFSGIMNWRTYQVDYAKRSDFQEIVNFRSTCPDRVDRALLSADLSHVLLLILLRDSMEHVGILMQIERDAMVGYYKVNNRTQIDVVQVNQFMIGPSGRHLALVTKTSACNKTMFRTIKYEVWTFRKNSRAGLYQLLHIQNSISAHGQWHGPAFTTVPGQGTDTYCVAFFKDYYRLKSLLNGYFLALVDMERNRYMRIAGIKSSEYSRLNQRFRDSQVHGIRASPSGDYLIISLDCVPLPRCQLLLYDTATLSHQKTLTNRLDVCCSTSALPTFSRCSMRFAIFRDQGSHNSEQVDVYQFQGLYTLQTLCRGSILRSCDYNKLDALPLPGSLRDFLKFIKSRPAEETYIEGNCGLRQ